MGNIDIYYSRRTNYAECYYWIRDEYSEVDCNQWVLENQSDGMFYAKESSPHNNQANPQAGVFMLDRNMITLETNDYVPMIKRGCVISYNGENWMVEDVQGEVKRKQSALSNHIDYRYYIRIRR